MRKISLLFALILSGCAGWQSSLDPHSAQALHIANLYWVFVAVCSLVWALVVGSLLFILGRRRRGSEHPEEDSPTQARRKTAVVAGLVVLTAAILIALAIASFYATRDFAWPNTHTMTIKVTGQQWWWDVEYQNPRPAEIFSTANEIHIPVGQPVTLELQASDVIHSFWVPNLMGKQDLIPGRTTLLTLQADKPGLYRGQCAEFCGLEHAKMAILVFADTPARFEDWRRHQIEAAPMPGDPARLRGLDYFVHGPCATCHAIAGTPAGGRTGPDLTHFGTRATIAAGLLPNTPAQLSRWLQDPQTLKPGNNMPQIDMSQNQRADLVRYLEGLK